MGTKELVEQRIKQTETLRDRILNITGYVQLTDSHLKLLYGYVTQFGFSTVEKAIEVSFDKYFNPFGEPYDEWDSFENTMKKIGGICYNWKVHGGKL